MKYFLGIDAGTTMVKAVVLSEDGYLAASSHAQYKIITPQYRFVESDPTIWWKACQHAVKTAVASSDVGDKIEAIGITGQLFAATMLDQKYDPVGNAIIWLDQRAGAEQKWIEDHVENDVYLKTTANLPDAGFLVPKLMWLQNHAPEQYNKIHKVLCCKDYLRFKMTGDVSTDVTEASGSFLFDVSKREWSDQLFSLFGIKRSIMPESIHESCDVAGFLLPDVAKSLGLRSGLPVIAGCGDRLATATGNSVIDPGMVSTTLGASSVVFAVTDSPIVDLKDRAAFSICHVQPQRWCLFGGNIGAGGSFKWLRDVAFSVEKKELAFLRKDVYDYMNDLAQSAKPGSEGLFFLPYLSGDRTPHYDPNASGVFLGITHHHGREEMCRSVIEGITFSLRDTLEFLRKHDIEAKELVAAGGRIESKLWRQIQADTFNASIWNTNIEEPTACGVALMAAAGCGAFGSLKEACSAIIKLNGKISPIPANVEIYEKYYQTYRALYPIMKEAYAKQSDLMLQTV
ncbi:MAG: xylulokinase [Christensenella sp.]|nr:xylulokinase [Christensenella sp.]